MVLIMHFAHYKSAQSATSLRQAGRKSKIYNSSFMTLLISSTSSVFVKGMPMILL
jgi:hypothetical protein